MEKYLNRKGERILIVKETARKKNGEDHYSIVNLDQGYSVTGFTQKSLKRDTPYAEMEQFDWDKPAEQGKSYTTQPVKGLVAGLQDTAGNFYHTYSTGLLDRHGFTRVMVEIANPLDLEAGSFKVERFALKIHKLSKPFLAVESKDVIRYLGDSRWKLVKAAVSGGVAKDTKGLAV